MTCGYLGGSGKWHAARWPGASSSSGGSVVWQMSCAFQHLVWNRQPGGGFSGLGTSPVSRIRSRRMRGLSVPGPAASPAAVPVRAAAGSGTGTADSSATV